MQMPGAQRSSLCYAVLFHGLRPALADRHHEEQFEPARLEEPLALDLLVIVVQLAASDQALIAPLSPVVEPTSSVRVVGIVELDVVIGEERLDPLFPGGRIEVLDCLTSFLMPQPTALKFIEPSSVKSLDSA
jgi:hypothetical protein